MTLSTEDEAAHDAELALAPVVAVMKETTRRRIAALPPADRTPLLAQAYALFVLSDLAKAHQETGSPVADWLDGEHITEAFAGIELLAKHGRLAPAEFLMPDELRGDFRSVVDEIRKIAVMGRFAMEQGRKAGSDANAKKAHAKHSARDAIMREACSALPAGASDKDRMAAAWQALKARWPEWWPAFSSREDEPSDVDLECALPKLTQFRAIVRMKPPG
ncbi:hypothetical protein [Neoroseomonas lacus]|uniref:Uncharacterized protein n=1 Tax=Neoroseomonas lacus TaxID=287609 RepID=A0A917NLT1_9PROT|nr:hypothetical protein [Neoroseomonas lacus]GGJ10862.1 hypothetical protein GCM10011320_17430 [Neoroseomonas lacus]